MTPETRKPAGQGRAFRDYRGGENPQQNHEGLSQNCQGNSSTLDREVLSKSLDGISNRTFLESLVGMLAEDTCIPVASNNDLADWTSKSWVPGQELVLPEGWNGYFCLGSHRRGNPQPRTKASAQALHIIMCDDIGTKVPRDHIGPEPTYEIETSPGNSQFGFLLSEPLYDMDLADRIGKAITRDKFSDPGAGGLPTRYARLPQGWNSKHNPPFRCRLRAFKPELSYTVQEIIDGLGLVLDPPKAERKAAENVKREVPSKIDPYVRKAIETELQELAAMPPDSGRNVKLNRVAFIHGQFVAGGEIDKDFAVHELQQAAAACGLDESEAAKTIESGLSAGMQEPRQAPGESDWNCDAGQTAGKSNNSYNSYNSSDELENWTPTEKTWPILQRAAMPGIIGDFVDVSTENSEADPAAVLATFLVRLGVEAGSPDVAYRPHVYVGETRHEPRLFAIVTGKSSKARKGTSAQPVQRLFTVKGTMGAPSMGGISFGPLSTGEGIIYAVRDAIQEWKEKEQIFVVTDPGITDKRLYVQEEELAAALSASKREGNTLSATLRALWDSGTRSPMTKTSKTRCTEAHVGILAHITLDELSLTLSDCDKLNGYANRFLWVLARRAKRVSRPTRIPESIFAPIQSTVWQRLNYAHKMGEMTLSGDFWDVFDSEYDRLSDDRPGMAGAITARAEAQVVRLSMVYAIAAGTRTVGAEHIQSALAFWNYSQASAEYIFADQTGGGKIDSTIKALIEGAHDGLSLTDIHKATGNNHKAGDLKASIQRLVDAGFVVSSSIRGPEDRKSRTVFFKNTSTNFTNFTNYSETPDSATEIIPDQVTI
jgi:hypothetical protein